MGFTPNQQLAIDIRDKNVLVSAAAGAGKTAVLVNRILERITDPDNPVDVDRLLVMTFTNAAATEMRERILKIIEKKRDESVQDANLYRQSMLAHNAHITTIHGFCQSILRDHFESAGINPDFRVGDENECILLQKDVVGKVLEDAYAGGNADFLKCVECFSSQKSDAKLENLILDIYKFSQSDPNPRGWLEKSLSIYELENENDFVNHPFVTDYMQRVRESLGAGYNLAVKLLEYIESESDLEKYTAAITADVEYYEKVMDILANDNAYTNMHDNPPYSAVKLGTVSNKIEGIEAKKEYVKQLRTTYQKLLKSLSQEFSLSAKENIQRLNSCGEQVRALVGLVCDFSDRFARIKRDKNIIDFNDMEHLAIKVLSENEHIAASYRDFFEEIYVDEYQDSNMTQEMLLELIRRKDDKSGNLFMVGDVKQSIYRFRQARPDLFVSKYMEYADETGGNKRIVLSDNFRSRSQVVDSVNEIFAAIMTSEHGRIVYDEEAMLRASGNFPKEGMMDPDTYKSTIMMASHCDEMTDMETEAHMIADKISKIHDSYVVWDKDALIYRPAKYSDIAILVRSLKGWDKVISEVFMAHDIPVDVTTFTGYFSSVEITTTMAFVAVVDNPLQDVELATFLRSEVCDFSDEELAVIKLNADSSSKGGLYEKIKEYTSLHSGEEADELADKCKRVIDLISQYREFAIYNPIHEVLKKFIDEIYAPHVKVMYDGAHKMANLNVLLKKSEDYGRTSYKGLFHFVRYINQIRKYDVDFAEASLFDESRDAVSVMTIHKSKGLEFPVCFVAGMTKQRFSSDESGSVMLSTSYGIGVNDIDLVRRTQKNTFLKNLIHKELYSENLAEEMRVLYVALTRAREKLIITGVIDTDLIFENPKSELLTWSDYYDLLGYAYNKLSGFDTFDMQIVSVDELTIDSVSETVDFELRKNLLLEALREDAEKDGEKDDEEVFEMRNRLSFSYPHKEREGSFYKMSVSDLKKLKAESIEAAQEAESELPNDTFSMYSGPSKGAFYGTAFHRLLELWDYNNSPEVVTDEDVSDFVNEMRRKNMISDEQAKAVKTDELRKFLTGELAGRMKKASMDDYLYREQPFVIGLKASEIIKMQTGVATEENDEYDDICLIQGIIDAFFVENNSIVIVDYKTDKVFDESELVRKYKIQLEYYAKALSKLMDMPVAQMIIYSSRLSKQIVL